MNLADIVKKFRKPRTVTISAVVTRADGTVEDLGVISQGVVTFSPEQSQKKES
jgi:hypothetical protein